MEKVIKKLNKITMKELTQGLGVEKGDIVFVKDKVLVCSDCYDLVNFGTEKYSSDIPNIILGMVSGKHVYSVYKVSLVTRFNEQ